MIRVNLLKPLQPQSERILDLAPSGTGKKPVLALVLGGLVLAGAAAFFALSMRKGEPEKPIPLAKAVEPKAPLSPQAKPAEVTDAAVEEILTEARMEAASASAPSRYEDLAPTARIAHQYRVGGRILQQVKEITPADMGFADFIFTPPGDFYIRGLAYTPAALEEFKGRLNSLEGASVRAGVDKPAGPDGAAREFSFFVTVRFPLEADAGASKVLSKSEVTGELAQVSAVAKNLGLTLNPPKLAQTSDAGAYKRVVYRSELRCNYAQLEEFIGRLREMRSNVGVAKFALKARGDEEAVANLDFMVYVN